MRTNVDAELLQFLYAFKVVFDSLLSSALLPAQPSQRVDCTVQQHSCAGIFAMLAAQGAAPALFHLRHWVQHAAVL